MLLVLFADFTIYSSDLVPLFLEILLVDTPAIQIKPVKEDLIKLKY
jgi:hypothetical protein